MKNALYVLLVAAIISSIFLIPFGIIWSLNTLFPALQIAYSFWTWLAVIILNLTWLSKPAAQNVKLTNKEK